MAIDYKDESNIDEAVRLSANLSKEIERRLNRRDWLLRAIFYIPLIMLIMVMVFSRYAVLDTEEKLAPIDSEVKTGDYGPLPAAAAHIAETAKIIRESQRELPYVSTDNQLVTYSEQATMITQDLTAIKSAIAPELDIIHPGHIPAVVNDLLQRALACDGSPNEEAGNTAGTSGNVACKVSIESPFPIYFSFGRADLTPEVRARLQQIVSVWSEKGRPDVTIRAYTDSKGSEYPTNRVLRRQRADVIQKYLAQNTGGMMKWCLIYDPPGQPNFVGYVSNDDEYLRVAVISFETSCQ